MFVLFGVLLLFVLFCKLYLLLLVISTACFSVAKYNGCDNGGWFVQMKARGMLHIFSFAHYLKIENRLITDVFDLLC